MERAIGDLSRIGEMEIQRQVPIFRVNNVLLYLGEDLFHGFQVESGPRYLGGLFVLGKQVQKPIAVADGLCVGRKENGGVASRIFS